MHHHVQQLSGSYFSRIICTILLLVFVTALLGSCAEDLADTPTKPSQNALKPTRTPKPRPTAVRPLAKAGWTILIYLDGDNDLEESAIDDFGEMASVGSNDRVNIIVQFDRIASQEDWDDGSHGNWTSVKRFRVERGMKPTKSRQLADLGELNMGDPAILEDFVSWGIATYPAERYGLIFWDHGAAWPGVASDDSSDGDMLTLPEMAEALASVKRRTKVKKLDLIGFDACLMSQIDVLGSVAPFGKVAIGSADLEPGEGWAWNKWLIDLSRDSDQDAAAIAPSIIESFTAFYEDEGETSVTLAAFDLDKIALVTKRLDALASTMITHAKDSYKAIGQARAYAAEYASGDDDISAIDLGYFAQALVKSKANPKITAAARALEQAIGQALIIQGYGSDHPNSSGISIYFPWKKKHYDADYEDNSPLTEDTHWDEFLTAFYKAGSNRSSRAETSQPSLSSTDVSAEEPISIEATISGSDTAYVYYVVGAISPNSSEALQLLILDYIYPPGTTGQGELPSWNDGDQVQLTWKTSLWYVSNGSEQIVVPFNAYEYGSDRYIVDGIYETKRTGKQLPVSLEFEIAEGKGLLKHIWALDTGGGDNPRPRELKPRAGDIFTPDILSYSFEGEEPFEEILPGESIIFGRAPLTAFEGPAFGGDYVIGLLVEDVAGDITEQYVDITVDN